MSEPLTFPTRPMVSCMAGHYSEHPYEIGPAVQCSCGTILSESGPHERPACAKDTIDGFVLAENPYQREDGMWVAEVEDA